MPEALDRGSAAAVASTFEPAAEDVLAIGAPAASAETCGANIAYEYGRAVRGGNVFDSRGVSFSRCYF